MPATTPVPLGASVLAGRWQVDVNTGTHAAPTWLGVFGVEDFKLTMQPVVKDDSDYDSQGFKSSTISAMGWDVALKLGRKVVDGAPTTYNPGQEALRTVSKEKGANNRVEIRVYEMPEDGPRVEAYQGYAAVSWTEDGGPAENLATVSCKLSGQGKLDAITHPDVAAVPRVFSVAPATGAAAGGDLVTIVGAGFLALETAVDADVEFASGNSADDYNIVDDNHIVALTPAHAAGAVTVIVTNDTGPSTDAVSYTYA